MTRAAPGRAAPASRERCDVRIVGCGRRFWGDDQIGLRVAERLANDPPARAAVIATEGSGIDPIADARSAALLIIVDAALAAGAASPGRVERVVYRSPQAPQIVLRGARGARLEPLGGQPADSSHGFSVREALELAAALDCLPPEVWIYVVASRTFAPGVAASAELEPLARDIAARIRADLAAWRRNRGE